jgi:AcrR family transcriptional regulator
MATAFSENEKNLIRVKLNNAAQECLSKFGVRKTTVDQLVQMAGISKGAFYSFYPTKEILFFKVMEEYQNSIIEEAIRKLNEMSVTTIQGFSDLIYQLYQEVRHSFIMNIIQYDEMEYLMRKIPEEHILNHHSFDDMLVVSLVSHLKIKDNIEIDVIAASLRAIFMSMLHVKQIGEKDFDKALRLLITGFAKQIIEEVS